MEVIGHREALLNLSRISVKDNPPQSHLFTGPEGVGKFLAARWFASLLNCLQPVSAQHLNPCGNCISCRKIKSGNHPDVKIIEPDPKTLNIRIEHVRELHRESSFLPIEGRKKVFIVRDSHRMLDGAASAYLKLLEEPPLHMVHILTSVNVHSMLPTIVSRCTKTRFTQINCDDLTSFLVDRTGKTAEESAVLAAISQGSPGRAVSFAGDDVFLRKRSELFGIMSAIHVIGGAELSVRIDSVFSADYDAELLFEFIVLWLRDLIMVKNEMPVSFLVNRDYLEQFREQAQAVSMWQIMRTSSFIEESRRQISFQVGMPLVLERLLKYISGVMKTL